MNVDTPPRSWRDRMLLSALRAVPAPLAKHALFLLQTHPALADGWGYHVRPIHYYEPLPDFREIPSAAPARRLPPAIDFALPAQVAFLQRLAAQSAAEIAALANGAGVFDFHNPYFAGVDAALYYALARDLKPARVIEIGGGYSTRMAHAALQRNRADGHAAELVCIEPDPQPRLLEAALPIRLIRQRVQDVAAEVFAELAARDILFIDSSHAVKYGSDVCHELLEIVPRLKAGVWIHIHDIFFPHDYPREWLSRRVAFNEQYLVEGFLSFNRNFAVRASTHWLCLDYPQAVDAMCPAALRPPGVLGSGQSLWLEKVA
jgi:predicted O-methyltransferase YrrM